MKIIKYTVISFVSVTVFLLLIVVMLQHSHSLITLHVASQNHFGFYIWRYLFIIIIVITWPKLMKLMGRRRCWDETFIVMMIKKRWWVLGFFVAMELIVWLGR